MEDVITSPEQRLSITLDGCGIDPAPVVELQNWFERPYDNSVATARTCYSSKVVYPEDVAKDDKAKALRDRIAASTYKAGHHTTIQHPTFQFVLKKVSRQFIWSFLHQHPFYNSEQVSQRYVKVRRGRYAVPPLPSDEARELFQQACDRQMQAYRSLLGLLKEPISDEYFKIYPARRRRAEKWAKAIDKRIYEAARYVLPVATHAHLYHTVSGLTIHRYRQLVEHFDCPAEQRAVVGAMVQLVEQVSPGFFQHAEDAVPLEETLEYELFTRFHPDGGGGETSAAFVTEFDERLGGLRSKLIDWKVNGQASLAQAVRSMLGVPKAGLSDGEAIRLVMDPATNGALAGGSLNLSAHLKLTRALHHPHYTFAKKLSHTADSQDQRHRMTPGSRPIVAAQALNGEPDLVLPPIVERTPAALEFFQETARETLKAMARLRELGADPSAVLYLLPNATAVRFEESGDLLNFHHKWSLRLCYLAQEEIWRASKEEVMQVQEIEPEIGALIGPPCWSRFRAKTTPYCPEGDRFCGVPAWGMDVADYQRVIRKALVKLRDRVVVVTGGGTGIGRATAEACATAGAKVVVCGRRQAPLEQTCAAIKGAGEAARWVTADLSRSGDPARVVAFAKDAFGKLDGLVNNAGLFLLEPIATTSDEELLRVYQVNVIGLLAMCRESIPALTASGGAIVNLSSVVGQGVLPGSVAYAGSKAAVDQITRCLAAELGPAGVRVNCVAPGTTETDMTAGLLADPEAKAQTLAGTPLGRLGRAEDIAPVIVHLLSDEARWVTGQVIQASGGLLL